MEVTPKGWVVIGLMVLTLLLFTYIEYFTELAIDRDALARCHNQTRIPTNSTVISLTTTTSTVQESVNIPSLTNLVSPILPFIIIIAVILFLVGSFNSYRYR